MNDRVVLARGLEQAVSLNHSVIVILDDGIEVGILQADISRDDLHGIGGIVHVVDQAVDDVELGLQLNLLLLVLGGAGQRRRCIVGQVDELVALLVLLQLTLGDVQFATNGIDTFLDELLSFHCHLVLVLVGIIVVALEELVQVVERATNLRVGKGHFGHSRRLAGGSHAELLPVDACSHLDGDDGSVELLILPLRTGVLLEDDDSQRGVDAAGEFLDVSLEGNRLLLAFYEDLAFHVKAFVLLGYLHVDGSPQYSKLMLGHVHDDGVVLILLNLADTAFDSIADIELQRLHHAAVDIGTAQYLQLVVETVTVGDETHVLEVHLSSYRTPSISVIVLNQHLHSRRIDRLSVAQVAKSQTQRHKG